MPNQNNNTVVDPRSGATFASQDDLDAYREFCERHELDDTDTPEFQYRWLQMDQKPGLAHDLRYLIQTTFLLETSA